jgi:F-type H+-transporting ATPase subunit b
MNRSLWLTPVLATVVATPAWAAEGGGPLEVNGGLVIWTLVVFGLLFFVLKRYAWPAILGAVEAREQALERQLAEAESNRAETARLLAEHKKLLAEGRSQAQALLVEAKSVAEKERAAAIERTRQEQDELLARARREIEAEKDKARADLRREAVDLSLAAAGKLISQRLDSAQDRAIAEAYLASLEKLN